MITDWKIVAAAVVGFAILTSAMILSSNGGEGTGFLTATQPKDKGISFSADLEAKPLTLNSPVDFLTAKFSTKDAEIYLDKKKIVPSSDTLSIELQDFRGKFSLSEGIEITGIAKRAMLSDLTFSQENSVLPISIKANSFDRANLENATLNSLSYTSSGTVDVKNGKQVIKVSKEPLELGQFIGKIEFAGSRVFLNGITDRISISKTLIQ